MPRRRGLKQTRVLGVPLPGHPSLKNRAHPEHIQAGKLAKADRRPVLDARTKAGRELRDRIAELVGDINAITTLESAVQELAFGLTDINGNDLPRLDGETTLNEAAEILEEYGAKLRDMLGDMGVPFRLGQAIYRQARTARNNRRHRRR